MKIVSADQVHDALSYPALIDALCDGFKTGFGMPPRQVFLLDDKDDNHDAFAVLPSWNDALIALKAFTYFPDNPGPRYKTLYSKILIFDRAHGEPLALIDGTSVTFWRTAGVSALAARLLSREDSESLLVLGTGNLSTYIIRAHASVRPLKRVRVWGRTAAKAEHVAAQMNAELDGVHCAAATDLEAACRKADIIVSATASREPLVLGDWIGPGTHTDFIGNHHAGSRECDTALVVKSKVYVDSYANCFKEAGEILMPIAEGVFTEGDVVGELAAMCGSAGGTAGAAKLRESDAEITFFKSVGVAYADLIGAGMAYRSVMESG